MNVLNYSTSKLFRPKCLRKKVDKPILEATDNIDVDVDDILGPQLTTTTAKPTRSQPSSSKKPADSLPSPTPSFSDLAAHSTQHNPKPKLNADAPRPGRIISNSRPLADFKKNVASEVDLVTKAVEDMCAIIPEVVDASFSSQRYEEALDCMKELRDVCLKEDEIDAWNNFLRKFKATCKSSDFRNKDFWKHVRGVGRKLSLISDTEAEANDGISDVTDRAAIQFMKS